MVLIDVLVVVDDAQTLRRHAHAVLGDPALRLVAAVLGEPAALALLKAAAPDVLLIDPGPDQFDGGIELTRHAARHYPCCAVLVVTRSGACAQGAAALAAGASGCLPRHASPERIAAGIRAAHAGGSRSCSAVQGHLLPGLPLSEPDVQPAAAVPALLTARETEILRLIEKGLGFGTVSALLDISPHTVVAHLRKIYAKLAVHTRGEAVHEAGQMGLL